jgi:hypothetical protein
MMKSYAGPNPSGDIEREQNAIYRDDSGAEIIGAVVEQRSQPGFRC